MESQINIIAVNTNSARDKNVIFKSTHHPQLAFKAV